MKKVWQFDVGGYSIRVTNSWLHGMKLYVDGDLKDYDRTFLTLGDVVMLSTRLGDVGVLEIEPKAIFSVEIDAFLAAGSERRLCFSSTKRSSLSLAKLSGGTNGPVTDISTKAK
jgi:hypothetical protein